MSKTVATSITEHAGDLIRRLRKSRNLTQQQLADLAELERVTLVHIELGQAFPSGATLERLGEALGVTFHLAAF